MNKVFYFITNGFGEVKKKINKITLISFILFQVSWKFLNDRRSSLVKHLFEVQVRLKYLKLFKTVSTFELSLEIG